MNQANKPVRAKTAVDVVNAIMLLLKLDSKQHQEHKEMAWKWTEFLTPYGKKLRDNSFETVKTRGYMTSQFLRMMINGGFVELSKQTIMRDGAIS